MITRHTPFLIQRGIFVLIVMSFVGSAHPPASYAAPPIEMDPIPSDILDPDSVGWASVRNMTSSQFADYFAQKSDDGYMLIDIEVDEIDDSQRVSGVWQKNLDGRGWYEQRNLTLAQFDAAQADFRTRGYRLIDQESYYLNGDKFYAGIWIQNKEQLDWVSYKEQTSADFATLFQRYKDAGYLIIDIDILSLSISPLYSAVWVKNSENLGWYEYRDMTSDEFSSKFEELKDQYRMIDIESYQVGNAQYYAGIWVENKNGRYWAEWRDMTAKGFGDKWLVLRDAGYRLINFEAYETKDGWRYAGIWRQNTSRPNWSLKDEVDALLEQHASDYDIPGMGVAVAQNGNFVYLRGFGFADIDDEIIASSRTVFRLASVSKAVAGVLSLRLSEQGDLNLAADTRDYVPAMPAFQTHTVVQTLSNRSGIGHYEDYPSISGEFTTALDAVQEIWDVPLVYPPGMGYKYSTHAYTFLGASIEGALNDPITDILNSRLVDPYTLNSLRFENLDQPDPQRATLYNSANDEVAFDFLDWKRLGGGIVSSAYDLGRFGIKLLNGSILSEASLTTMWTPPDNASNYALGWDTGTESGTQVVAKDGAQNGSKTYIRMYPEQNIVIVVLTNRKNGGHSPATVAKAIGALMLGELGLNGAAAISSHADRQMIVADPEIEEPEAEAQDPAQIAMPIAKPVSTPTPDDLQEPPGVPINDYLNFLPAIQR